MKIINSLYRKAIPKNILYLFLAYLIVQATFLAVLSPIYKTHSGGRETLDITVFYSSSYVEELFSTLSPDGFQFYLSFFFPLDLLFPALYSAMLAFVLAYLVKKIEPSDNNRIRGFVIFPFIAAAFDYLENFGIVSMMLHWPNFSNPLATITSVFSSLKGVFILGSVGVLVILLFLLLIRKIKSSG